jgi:lipid-binding SYLF domain-containing protein
MNRSIKDSFGLIVSSAMAIAMLLCLAVTPARAQKKNSPDRITKAAQRSENAAQVLDVLMASNQVVIAQYLLDNAQAVAVFPQTIRTSVLLNVLIHGQGVVSRRVPGGWGAPAFFTFKGADINFKFGKESMNIIIFFMNDEAVSWLLKEKIGFDGKKKAVTSLIGKGELKPDTNVIIYTATAEGFGSVEHLGIGIGADNDLNKIVYGLKAREILADTQNKITRNAPEGIYQFPQSLARYSARQ